MSRLSKQDINRLLQRMTEKAPTCRNRQHAERMVNIIIKLIEAHRTARFDGILTTAIKRIF